MIRYLSSILIALIIAIPSGFYGSAYIFKYFDGFSHLNIGQWQATPLIGTHEADPYAKAHRLQHNNIPLGSAEGLKFEAWRDNEKHLFNSNCTYKIIGTLPIARFFTLYAIDENFLLIDGNAPYPSRLNSDDLILLNNDDVEITISAYAQPGNWLYIPKNKKFGLALTLYDSPIDSENGLVTPLMPAINRIKDKHCD